MQKLSSMAALTRASRMITVRSSGAEIRLMS